MLHEDDLLFLSKLMSLTSRTRKPATAIKIEQIVIDKRMDKIFLINEEERRRYYFSLLVTLIRTSDIDTVMKYYSKYIPYKTTLSLSVYWSNNEGLIEKVKTARAFVYIPKLWQDLRVG